MSDDDVKRLRPIAGVSSHDGFVPRCVRQAKIERPGAVVLTPVVLVTDQVGEFLDSLMRHKADAEALVVFIRSREGHVTKMTVEFSPEGFGA